jgi:hypothetical protein
MKSRPVIILLSIVILCTATAQLLAARSAHHGAYTSADGDVIWTSWDAAHYALIDDGESLWIGTGNGLVKYNKASGSRLRTSSLDGLPHYQVFCGAVDQDGNRWFGGDGGLSKLNAAGEWTHFNPANSQLQSDFVSGIAVTTAGDIWLSYEDVAAVSRLHTGGSWTTYPNRETAVSLAYEDIKQTINANELWTTAGDEVWVGYKVFDGLQWSDRTPEKVQSAPQALQADSRNHVWAIGRTDYRVGVLEWDGARWQTYEFICEGCIDAYLTHLAVDKNDVVWVGGELFYPYSRGYLAYDNVPDEPGSFTLDRSLNSAQSAISDMTATDEGLWITGANWLRGADGVVRQFAEVPYLNNVTRLIVDGHGTTWLHSGHYNGVLQILDDRGTGTLRDDTGQIVAGNMDSVEFEVAANGDLWLAWVEDAVRFQLGHGPRRYVNGAPVDYEPPIDDVFVHDIYVEDGEHTWFIYEPYFDDDSTGPGIWRLDDSGTPADQSDDIWTSYAISGTGKGASVAARDGKLWYGDSTGVYLHDEGSWQQLFSGAVEELIPAANGVLLAAIANGVLLIEEDGDRYWRPTPDLVLNNYALVRSTTRRNTLWRSAPDGTIWFWLLGGGLGRWDGRTLQTYHGGAAYGGFIEVDNYNHVWLIEGHSQWQEKVLWRMSPRPDFRISAGPSTWFITPNGSRTIAVSAAPFEGYTKQVALSLTGLPPGVTAQLDPALVSPGQQALVTITARGALPGTSVIALHAASSDIVHKQTISLAVVDQTHESWMPVTAYAR